MEEQRQRQEEEQRRATAESAQDTDPAGVDPVAGAAVAAPTSDEAMLERALALSTETPVKRHRVRFVSVLSFFGFFYVSNFQFKIISLLSSC